MPQFTCAIEGCTAAKHEAKGMCRLHYRRTLKRTPDKPETGPCIVCGTIVTRTPNSRRVFGMTCSDECKRRLTWGWSEPLPEMHWARMYGATCEWKPPVEPKVPAPRFIAGTCTECGKTYVLEAYGNNSSYCSVTCSGRVSKRRRRAREHNAQGDFTFTEIMRLYHQAGRVCAYCRQPIVGLPDPEHLQPLSRGGRNDSTNLLASCRACNTDKSDLTLDEWRDSRASRGLPAVFTDVYSRHEGYRHLVQRATIGAAYRDRTAA